MSGELPGGEKVVCNVCEEQIDEAVGSALDILQLDPELSDGFYALLVNWLDENNVDVIPMGSFE